MLYYNKIYFFKFIGRVAAYIWVLEFQKRGLPHIHCIFWMQEGDKIRHGRELDDLILAEIPDPQADPLLYQLVTERMLHNCNDICRPPHLAQLDQNGLPIHRCLKGFPQPFSDETRINENHMPAYRRTNNERVHRIGQKVFDNKYVVPYNPYLLKHFQSHINVEYIAFASSMKYLFKYVTKGNDQARVYATVAPGHGNLQAAANPQVQQPVNNQPPLPQNDQVNNQQPPVVQQQPIQGGLNQANVQLPNLLPQNSQANNHQSQQQPAIVAPNQAPPLRNSQIAMPPPPPPPPAAQNPALPLRNSQVVMPPPPPPAAPINNDQQQNHQPADRANRVIYNEIEDYISKL